MTPEQLDVVVGRTGAERFRWLTSDDNPDVEQRDGYRAAVERMAEEPPPPIEPPAYPPLATQAANLAKAAGRFVASGLATVDQAEYDRRRSVCTGPCPTGRYDAVQDRCRACGCSIAVKPWSKAERCPDGHW